MNTELYFDYAATTPLHPTVRQTMLETLDIAFGNPSSMHLYGEQVRQIVASARAHVAQGLGATPSEIIFTSGATEAANLALIGIMQALPSKKNHLITSQIEHHATLHTAEQLKKRGYDVTFLPVDTKGRVSLREVKKAIRPETGLISIMMVNNETGVLQNIAGIGKIAKENKILLHTDAVQAINSYVVDVDKLQVDLLSLSAHKIYGPKGVGALYVREGVSIEPIMYGGTQEAGLRPGTENVPGIAGFGEAMALRNRRYMQRYEELSELRSQLIQLLKNASPSCQINGASRQVAPHILSVSFPNVDGELMLFLLSEKGVALSMGSACTSENMMPSHVLLSMQMPIEQIESTLRISLGEFTTIASLRDLVTIIADALKKSSAL
ncbi:MAG: cysteine desulfurase [Chloroflexi bacterium]|nr:cysteine desulfurase [Chloroflexota bacterium]